MFLASMRDCCRASFRMKMNIQSTDDKEIQGGADYESLAQPPLPYRLKVTVQTAVAMMARRFMVDSSSPLIAQF